MGVLLVFLSEEIAQLESFKATLKDEKQIAELEEIIKSLKEKAKEKSE